MSNQEKPTLCLKDNLIISPHTHPGFSWKFLLNSNLAVISALLPEKLFRFLSFSLSFVSVKERIRNCARRAHTENNEMAIL